MGCLRNMDVKPGRAWMFLLWHKITRVKGSMPPVGWPTYPQHTSHSHSCRELLQTQCSVIVAKKLHNWSYLLVNTHSEKNSSVTVITHLVITEGGAKITKPAAIITKLRSQST